MFVYPPPHYILFEPLDDITAGIIRSELQIMVNNYEPRIDLHRLDVNPDYDNDGFNVTINFSVKNNLNPITIALFLQRLR